MKKYFLFAAAALLSLSMFAGDGSTKANAIDYDWQNGTSILPKKDQGLWYNVNLEDEQSGLNAYTNPEAQIIVRNPMTVEVTLKVTAYVGDESQVKELTIAAGQSKSITLSAALLLKMGIKNIYLYVETDKDIVEQKEVADVNGVQPGEENYIPTYEEKEVEINVGIEPAGTINFVPVDFVWGEDNTIAANKETWLTVQLPLDDLDEEDNMVKLTLTNLMNAAANVEVAYSPECPAHGITEQARTVGANASIVKTVDVPALIAMANSNGLLFIRIKSNKALNLKAETISTPADANFVFDATTAQEVVYDQTYNIIDAAKCFWMNIGTLRGINSNQKPVVEITNTGVETLVLNGAIATVVKPFSANERSLTIAPGQTVKRAIDLTMVKNMANTDNLYGELKANESYSFTFKAECADEYPCANAIEFSSSDWSGKLQTVKSQWYAVELTNDMKTNGQNLEVTIETNTTTHLTVDVALECTCGAPRQTYKSTINKTSTKLISNSLFKGIDDNTVYVRVESDQEITVKVAPEEIVPTVSGNWNDANNWNAWDNGSKAVAGEDEDVRVNGATIIPAGYTAEVKGVDIYGSATLTIKGKLIVGDNGITGTTVPGQLVIEEGAEVIFLGTANTTPIASVEKNIVAKKVDDTYTYQAIALPATTCPALTGISTYAWETHTGWVGASAVDDAFTGYLLVKRDATPLGKVVFSGETFGRGNHILSIPSQSKSDHLYGNSYLANIFTPALCLDIPNELFVLKDNMWQAVSTELIGIDHDLCAPIKVGEAFAVRGYDNAAQSFTLSYEDHVLSGSDPEPPTAPARVASANTKQLRLTIEAENGKSDRMYLAEGEDYTAGKMMNNRPNLNVYTKVNGDICTMVRNENLIGTIVTFESNNSTNYTLRAELVSGDIIYVKDLVNGNVIALTEGAEYNFTAEANKTNNRFQVIGVQHVTTGIESTEIEGINKVIENGQVMIIKNGVKYNTVGQIVK